MNRVKLSEQKFKKEGFSKIMVQGGGHLRIS